MMKPYFLLLLILGCSTLGNRYSPTHETKPSEATLYFYRIKMFRGSAASPFICVDGKLVGEAVNGSYVVMGLGPGRHKMELKVFGRTSGTFYFSVQPGNAYYARMSSAFYQDKETSGLKDHPELGSSFDHLDSRVESSSTNRGLYIVDPKFAVEEISKTRAFVPSTYPKNYCE